MKFLLDENFPTAACQLLRDQHHTAIDIRAIAKPGIEDEKIFELAQQHQAILLSTDRDFFHTIPHLHPHHHGVIVIALRQPNRSNILSKLRWFLDHFGNTNLDNKVFQLRDHTYITYPIPE